MGEKLINTTKQMFRITFIFLTLLHVLYLKGQENLIVNGSFEEYTSCPTGNELGNGQFQKCVGWWYSNPSGIGTPDYFNRCNNGIVSVPNNFWGYQEPYDGDGYVGILPLSWMISEGDDFSREMIQTKLYKSLVACQSYKLSFQINLSSLSNYKLNHIQINLSPDSLYHADLDEITNYHGYYNLDISSVDSSGWFRIETEFTSNGGEQFLTLGFLDEEIRWDTVFFQENINFGNEASQYYFIDNLELVQINETDKVDCSISLPNSFTPNNDGANDIYDLSKYLDAFDIYILNRWGNNVFELTDFSTAWDGTSKNGQPCAEGVYYYYVKDKETKENIKSGFIHLFR